MRRDKWLLGFALGYVFLPVVIFCFGWLKLPLAVLFAGLITACGIGLYRRLRADGAVRARRFSPFYWVLALMVILVWVYFSGIGSFSYQTGDFWVRNPIYRDLVCQDWPVYYDISGQSQAVRNVVGADRVAFAYYFSWWLPAAALSRLLPVGELGSNMILYLWAVLGIVLLLFLLNRYLNRNSYVALIVLICFSGLDAAGYMIEKRAAPPLSHIEFWARHFQYSSNTTQLYWVFNQSIPVWLVCALALQFHKREQAVGLCAMVFAYSPWAAFGIIPIAFSALFRKDARAACKGALTPENLLLPLILLALYGTFYTSNSGSLVGSGFIFSYVGNTPLRTVLIRIGLFLFLEAGIYFMIMGRKLRNDALYYTVLAELMLIPFYHMSNANDWAMRASIPPLFFCMVFVIQFLHKRGKKLVFRKILLVVCLCIGAYTPFIELRRNIVNTMTWESYLHDPVYSFAAMRTEDENRIKTVRNQFFVCDYRERFFFRYLAR